jgi:hypothetical protein
VGQDVPPPARDLRQPDDPQKRVYVVDDYRHAVFIFSHDGKQLLKTLGEPNVHASDAKHFYRPTFIAWDPTARISLPTATRTRASSSTTRTTTT